MTKKLTTREKFLRGLKRGGYDVEKSHQYWTDMSKKLEAQKKEYERQGILKPSIKEDGEGGMVGGSPVNNVGSGAIAGLGVGPQGEPGIKKKKKTATFISFIRRKAPK